MIYNCDKAFCSKFQFQVVSLEDKSKPINLKYFLGHKYSHRVILNKLVIRIFQNLDTPIN